MEGRCCFDGREEGIGFLEGFDGIWQQIGGE
jgi:hypothetical protein